MHIAAERNRVVVMRLFLTLTGYYGRWRHRCGSVYTGHHVLACTVEGRNGALMGCCCCDLLKVFTRVVGL